MAELNDVTTGAFFEADFEDMARALSEECREKHCYQCSFAYGKDDEKFCALHTPYKWDIYLCHKPSIKLDEDD